MRRFLPILILVIGAVALYVDFFPGARFAVFSSIDAGLNQPLQTKLGLDLQGGFSATYQAQPIVKDGKTTYPDSAAMETIRNIVESRVNSTGAVEAIVETQGSDQVVVQVPGATDRQAIESLVGNAGLLTFVPLDRNTYGYMTPSTGVDTPGTKPRPNAGDNVSTGFAAPLFSGDQVDGSATNSFYDSKQGKWAVNLGLKDQAKTAFSTWSGNNVGSYFMIVLDGRLVEAPFIQSAITTGSAEISGGFTAQTANQLASLLQYGALPFSLTQLSSSDIPATLGQSFLNQTILAGAIGILLVMIFMLIYYRLPGAIAVLALSYYGVVVLAIFRIVPVTLTLAGIAGFVLSVGMAVDANILIFERTKEELRAGKTLVSAVEAGFNRAWNSILDSNVSSLITASILYFGGSSTIKGFALVLMIGVLTSMFTAVTVSRTLLRQVVHRQSAQRAWMYGVSDEEFQARAIAGRMGSRREARSRV
ncbi:MAG TPA: protein translocase subunit SecD [Candidatus Limnocylindrales bacterium]